MKQVFRLTLLALVISSCTATRNPARNDHKISVQFVQINDVYEIAPLSGGSEGGMARVATIKKKYLQKNPNTFLVLAGDFLSPSVFNSLSYQGQPIRGRQMIEALNVAGTDLACFGNHEFDIKENELLERLNESEFRWVSTNAFHNKQGTVQPFTVRGQNIPKTITLRVSDADGTTAKIGFIGICLPFNKADFVSYTNALQSAKDAYNELKDSVDAVVAITHQNMWEDEQLAREIPGLAMIIGGHEHDQRYAKIGNVPITKSMANAKTAYVISLRINTRKDKIKVKNRLELLNEDVPLDSATNVVVQKWSKIAEASFAAQGFTAGRIVLQQGEPLEGRESKIRSEQTNLGRLVAASMLHASPRSQIALLNSGSIRVDDVLHAPITEYDIIRTMPYGGAIMEVEMKGDLLIRVLDQGKKNIGSGGYLVYNEAVAQDANGKWTFNGKAIDPSGTYAVAIGEFLFSGKETNLDFLHKNNPGIVKVHDAVKTKEHSLADIRLAVIRYLGNMK